MAVATGQLVLYLLTAAGLVRCRATDRLDSVEVIATDLDGESWQPLSVSHPKLFGVRLFAAE